MKGVLFHDHGIHRVNEEDVPSIKIRTRDVWMYVWIAK